MENHSQLAHILKLMSRDHISDTTSIGPMPPSEPKCIKGRIIVKNTWYWKKQDGEALGETIGDIAICEHQAYYPPPSPTQNLERRRNSSDRRYSLLMDAMTMALRRGGVDHKGSCTFCLTDFVVDVFPKGVVLTFWKDLGGVPRLDGRSVYRTEGRNIVCELYESNLSRLDEDDISVYGWARGSPYTAPPDDEMSDAPEEGFETANEYPDEGYDSAKQHLEEGETDKD